jgi:hypothetical protein
MKRKTKIKRKIKRKTKKGGMIRGLSELSDISETDLEIFGARPRSLSRHSSDSLSSQGLSRQSSSESIDKILETYRSTNIKNH